VTQNERNEIRNEVLREVRDALDTATDFEGFRDALEESDPNLPGLTVSEISAMTPQQILANKTAVDAVMSSQPTAAPAGEPVGPGPLSLETIKKMTPAQVSARWPEVSAVLERSRS
jgi:hypothetical protein